MVLIGLILGLIFGFIVGLSSFIISYFKRSDEYLTGHSVTMGSLITFSIFPGLIIIIISIAINGRDYWFIMTIIGILLIPILTRAISNTISEDFNLNKIGKTLIIYIPLGFAMAIILYQVIGYLGFPPSDRFVIHLSDDINAARLRLPYSPLASLAPGIAITCLIMSFLLLHIALQDYSSDFRE